MQKTLSLKMSQLQHNATSSNDHVSSHIKDDNIHSQHIGNTIFFIIKKKSVLRMYCYLI